MQEKGASAAQVVTKTMHTGSVADAVWRPRDIQVHASDPHEASEQSASFVMAQVLAGVRSVYASLPSSIAQGEVRAATSPSSELAVPRRLHPEAMPRLEAGEQVTVGGRQAMASRTLFAA